MKNSIFIGLLSLGLSLITDEKHYIIIMKRFVTSLLCMVSFGILGAQTVYYVSPDGKDKNSGIFKSPFKTIEKAKLQARQSPNDVTIYLREGIYRLEAPLIFTPEDV